MFLLRLFSQLYGVNLSKEGTDNSSVVRINERHGTEIRYSSRQKRYDIRHVSYPVGLYRPDVFNYTVYSLFF